MIEIQPSTRDEAMEPSDEAAPAVDYRRVEKAIRYLDAHRDEQPTLDDVADHLGLSKYHFHRLFQRWAGTTPKRFLQHLTVEHARDVLRESRSVLDAAFQSGLSGGGRLHDHFVKVEAVTPGEVRSGGRDLRIEVGVHPSPFGDAFVAATDRGICFLGFLPDADDSERPAVEERSWGDLEELWPEAELVKSPDRTGDLVLRAFEAVDRTSDEILPLHLRGTNFQLQVWRALLRIPQGHATSYGELARQVGRPGAARAVGGAVGANPVSLLIPCHRVLRSTGGFGGYRWGPARKRAILAREREAARRTG